MRHQTKRGTKMSVKTEMKITAALADMENDILSREELAAKLNITVNTLWNYTTPELLANVRKLRSEMMQDQIPLIDKAILAKALEGDLTAAKLLYSRIEKENSVAEQEKLKKDLKTLEDIDHELQKIKEDIDALQT